MLTDKLHIKTECTRIMNTVFQSKFMIMKTPHSDQRSTFKRTFQQHFNHYKVIEERSGCLIFV